MDVSKNSGTPKSSILIGFSIVNRPFWGIPIFGNTHIHMYIYIHRIYTFAGDNEGYHCHNDPYIIYRYKIKCMVIRFLQPIAFDHH